MSSENAHDENSTTAAAADLTVEESLALEEESSASEEVVEAEPQVDEERLRAIKEPGGRELGFLRKVVRDYPGFDDLAPGDQLDRMICVLQMACGYGAVSVRTVEVIQEKLLWQTDFAVEEHFRESTFESREGEGVTTRYRESFAGGYGLKREYLRRLTEDDQDAGSEDQVIRKRVASKPEPLKPKAQAQSSRVISKPSAPKQPTPKQSTPKQSSGTIQSRPSNLQPVVSEQGAAVSKPESVDSRAGAETNPSPIKPWMVMGGVGILLVVVVLSFLLF